MGEVLSLDALERTGFSPADSTGDMTGAFAVDLERAGCCSPFVGGRSLADSRFADSCFATAFLWQLHSYSTPSSVMNLFLRIPPSVGGDNPAVELASAEG